MECTIYFKNNPWKSGDLSFTYLNVSNKNGMCFSFINLYGHERKLKINSEWVTPVTINKVYHNPALRKRQNVKVTEQESLHKWSLGS